MEKYKTKWTQSFPKRFLSKFRIGDGCWEWVGRKTLRGYGDVMRDYKYKKAHRCSYELFIGAIPIGKNVCHKCDNPSCVNPSHLFLGTQADNLADMRSKGRGTKLCGEQLSKVLTDEKVVQIIKSPLSRRKIAKEFGVSGSCIQTIRNGRSWKHVHRRMCQEPESFEELRQRTMRKT